MHIRTFWVGGDPGRRECRPPQEQPWHVLYHISCTQVLSPQRKADCKEPVSEPASLLLPRSSGETTLTVSQVPSYPASSIDPRERPTAIFLFSPSGLLVALAASEGLNRAVKAVDFRSGRKFAALLFFVAEALAWVRIGSISCDGSGTPSRWSQRRVAEAGTAECRHEATE